MAAGLVINQLKHHPGLHPACIRRLHAKLQRKLIHHGKGRAIVGVDEHVGILPQGVGRVLAVDPVEPHGQVRRQMVGSHKFHQPPHAHLPPEALGDFQSLAPGDPGQCGQPFRVMLQHIQALASKGGHDALRRLLPDSLDDPGGEVGEDLIPALGHIPLQHLRLKLPAVGGMSCPVSRDCQALPHSRHGNGAHHGDHLPVLGLKAQHCIAVFRILKDDRRHGAIENFVIHAAVPLSFVLWYNKSPGFSMFCRGIVEGQKLHQRREGAVVHPVVAPP